MAFLKRLGRKLRGWALSRRALRCAVVLLCLAGLAWLATWLGQRSLRTPARKRAVQAWLDDTFNADVAILGDMTVRLNLVRDSRLVLDDVEIEHPNPVFPGKFARIGSLGVWAPPWSAAGLFPGSLNFRARDVRVEIEQAASGEWSHDGLMRPLASGDSELPFPMPKMRHWDLSLERVHLDLRRRGYELGLDMNARVTGRQGRDSIRFHADSVPFTFGLAESADTSESPDSSDASSVENRRRGVAASVNLGLRLGEDPGSLPAPIPGDSRAAVTNLPIAMLPFIATGIPMEDSAGVFNGLIRYDRHEQAAGSVFIEGELNDAPLAVFGLPRSAPLRLNWPLSPAPGAKLGADIHMGPSGFGAFAMTIPLADDGRPEALSMRGDLAQLDDVPGFFRNFSRWPDWLSRTFPLIEWRTGKWRGFGWEGENLVLALSRGAAGMNLSGEAELLGGRARLSMTPGQADTAIAVSAENLDGAALAAQVSRLLPAPFQAKTRGSSVSLSWRGLPDDAGALSEWGAGIVWTDLAVDVTGSGTWWHSLSRVPEAVALALPEWGGGDGAELMALSAVKEIELDQLSVVVDKGVNGTLTAEFRAFGDALGQATGFVEQRGDGSIEGEILFTGESAMLAAAEQANPELAFILRLLANGFTGLRVAFRHDAERGGNFIFPFLQDALEIRETLSRREEEGGEREGGE